MQLLQDTGYKNKKFAQKQSDVNIVAKSVAYRKNKKHKQNKSRKEKKLVAA